MGSTEDFGRSSPLGATLRDGGVNFSLYSRNTSKVELLFFDREDNSNASRIIPINPGPNRTYHYWHTFVPGVQLGQVYGYRVYGWYEPSLGFRFDSRKVLLDPYARSIAVVERSGFLQSKAQRG